MKRRWPVEARVLLLVLLSILILTTGAQARRHAGVIDLVSGSADLLDEAIDPTEPGEGCEPAEGEGEPELPPEEPCALAEEDQPDEPDGEEGSEGEDGAPRSDAEPDPERVAACESAAGEPGEGSRGPARARGRVLENCVRNPNAPGLVNALERLDENRRRHEARGGDEQENEQRGRKSGSEERGRGREAHGGGNGNGRGSR